MHEMALTESVVRILEQQASQAGYGRVTTVWLEIGALSPVDPDSILFCFPAVSRGTVAEGARLEIVALPGRAWCLPCGQEVTIAERAAACPKCGGHRLQVTAGADMRVREIEVE